MKNFLLLFTFFFLLKSQSQLPVYQDVFYGGVTGDGYNPWYLNNPGFFNINIEPSSTIRKAFLFVSVFESPDERQINFNGNIIKLNSSNAIDNTYLFVAGPIEYNIKTLLVDITDLIDPLLNVYSIIPPFNQTSPLAGGSYTEFYLLVLYENPSLQKTAVSIYVNDQNPNAINLYDFQNINPMNLSNNVGLSIHSGQFCDSIQDGSFVKVNANLLGLIGGKEDNTSVYCAGVTGSYFYQNGTLFGLGNDIANNSMAGLDAIATVETYLTNTTSFDLLFEYQSNLGPNSNPINQIFLTYTTPCDTFSVSVSNDTTICSGETLQLFASGGQSYEWSPATDLSCTNCPNPIFSGDSSRFYTVQIWNNDSCSVVRPIKVNVRPEIKFGNISTFPSDCGTNNGSVTLSAAVGTQTPITFTLNNTLSQTSGTFNNLAEGTYSFHFTDGNGCVSEDTVITIGEINTTMANFTLSPNYGVVPLEVSFVNSSVNATDYAWSINGFAQGNNLSSYTCDTSGTYTIQLIAWQYDPSCADTVVMALFATDRIIIPTAFTPDNDGVNDRWVIPNIKNIYPKHLVRIYNRWGTLIYEAPEGKYSTYPWKGIYEDEVLPVGSYYFIIDPNDGVTDVLKGIVSIVRE